MEDGRESTNEPVPEEEPGAGDVASVIVVDKREDVATICGRIESAPTFAVVIHAPRGNQQLATEYGMRRLRRFAEETGHAIAIATGNRALVSRAVGAGLPVARKPANIRWDRPGRNVVSLGPISLALPPLGPWPGMLAILIGIFLLVLAALFVLPSATVTVVLAGEPVSGETEISVVAGAPQADPAEGVLLARQVMLTETVLVAVKTTGKAEVPTGTASAVVSVTAPAEGIQIPAGAVLLAGTVRFRLDSDLSLGPREVASTTVTAVQPGPSGNVAAGAIDAWEDERYSDAIVTNPTAAAGGTKAVASVVTEADLEAAIQKAEGLASSPWVAARLAAAREGELVIAETVSATAEPHEPAVAVGEPAEFLVLEVDLEITGQAVPAEELVALARALYESGSRVVLPGSVTVRQLEPAFIDEEDRVFARVEVSATLVSALEPGAIRSAVTGRRPEKAKENLLARYRMEDAEIQLTPSWAPFVPRLGARIDVEIRATTGEEVEAPSGS